MWNFSLSNIKANEINFLIILFIGALVKTIRDLSQLSNEVCYNLELLHYSWLEFEKKNFLSSFKLFINQINSLSKQARPHSINNYSSQNICLYHYIPSLFIINSYIKHRQYELSRTISYNSLQFSYKNLCTTGRTHEGCVLYYDSEDTTKLRIGFIQCAVKFIDVKQNNILSFIEQAKIPSVADTLNINGKQYECNNVLHGYIYKSHQFVLVRPEQITKKLAFHIQNESTQNKFFFYRYTNESMFF